MKYALTQEQVELIREGMRALTFVAQEELDEVRYNTPFPLLCEGVVTREIELQEKLRAITALQNLFEQQEKELSTTECPDRRAVMGGVLGLPLDEIVKQDAAWTKQEESKNERQDNS